MLIHALTLAMSLYANPLSAEPIDRKPLDPPPESSEQSFTILDPTITLEITRPGAPAPMTIRSVLYFETKREHLVLVIPRDHDIERLFQKFPAPIRLSETADSLIIFFEETGQRELQSALATIGIRLLSTKDLDY